MIQYPIDLFSNRDFRDIKQPTEKLEIQISLKSMGKTNSRCLNRIAKIG